MEGQVVVGDAGPTVHKFMNLELSRFEGSNFMVKIENHPGIDSAKFLTQYKSSTGPNGGTRKRKAYNLPKREAVCTTRMCSCASLRSS
jgi:hypothetical protein